MGDGSIQSGFPRFRSIFVLLQPESVVPGLLRTILARVGGLLNYSFYSWPAAIGRIPRVFTQHRDGRESKFSLSSKRGPPRRASGTVHFFRVCSASWS